MPAEPPRAAGKNMMSGLDNMNKQQFLEGIRDGIPICLGYFSVSLAIGLSAVLAGMPLWSTVLISLTNLTSAGQVAGINLLVANASLVELALTTLIINIRYFLMSLSVSQKVESRMTLKERMIVSFGITDEIFAVSMQRRGELTSLYMLGLILTPLIGWTGGTLVGAVASSFMPAQITSALGIALYGMFIAIIIPPAREHKNVLITVILAVLASLAFTYLPLLKNLSSGWSIIIITIAVSALAAWLFPVKNAAEEVSENE